MAKVPKPTSISYSWWHKNKPSVLPKSGVGELLKKFEKKTTQQRIQELPNAPITNASKVIDQYMELEQQVKNVQKVASAKKDCAEFYAALTDFAKLIKEEREEIVEALKVMQAQSTAKPSKPNFKNFFDRWPAARKDRVHEATSIDKLLASYSDAIDDATDMEAVTELMAKTKGLASKILEFRKAIQANLKVVLAFEAENDDPTSDDGLLAKSIHKDLDELAEEMTDKGEAAGKLQEKVMKVGKDLKGTKKAGKAFLGVDQDVPNVRARKKDDNE